MFGFHRKTDNALCMPVKGKCMDLSLCTDKAFSEKKLGDGFMVEPQGDTICSPCDGWLTMVFPTKHAFGLRMNDGTEVLVHIGINTVQLGGQHFETLTSAKRKVKKQTPLIRCDIQKIRELGYDPSVLVIVCGKQGIGKQHLNEYRDVGDIIIEGSLCES